MDLKDRPISSLYLSQQQLLLGDSGAPHVLKGVGGLWCRYGDSAYGDSADGFNIASPIRQWGFHWPQKQSSRHTTIGAMVDFLLAMGGSHGPETAYVCMTIIGKVPILWPLDPAPETCLYFYAEGSQNMTIPDHDNYWEGSYPMVPDPAPETCLLRTGGPEQKT